MLNTPTTEARIYIKPGFAWDEQNAYLFDIDGTLLRNRDRIHRESFIVGVQQVMGVDIQQVLFLTPGGTDPAILSYAFEKAGIACDTKGAQWTAILDAMYRSCEERRREMDIRIMPGVEEVLAHLAQRGALLGVATGNLEMIGWIKIEEAGLRELFSFGGFSDHFPVRSELVADAARKARRLAGENARICVVGDTPRDIAAAHANQLPVIAVATGHFGFDELLEGRPEVCASSLADLLATKRTVRE